MPRHFGSMGTIADLTSIESEIPPAYEYAAYDRPTRKGERTLAVRRAMRGNERRVKRARCMS